MSQVLGFLFGIVIVISFWILVFLSQVDGKNVICKVEYESFEKFQLLIVNFIVYYFLEVFIFGYDNNWYFGQNEVILICDVCSNLEFIGYNWSMIMGFLLFFVVVQGVQFLICFVDKLINIILICNVINVLGVCQVELIVQVKEGFFSEYLGMFCNVIIFLVLGILVFLILLGIGIYFYWFKCFCEVFWYCYLCFLSIEYVSVLVNGYVFYLVVSRENSFFQDLQIEGIR